MKFEPLPKQIDDNTDVCRLSQLGTTQSDEEIQVWIIDETGEVFIDYEKFLNRCVDGM